MYTQIKECVLKCLWKILYFDKAECVPKLIFKNAYSNENVNPNRNCIQVKTLIITEMLIVYCARHRCCLCVPCLLNSLCRPTLQMVAEVGGAVVGVATSGWGEGLRMGWYPDWVLQTGHLHSEGNHVNDIIRSCDTGWQIRFKQSCDLQRWQ